jgi:superfamily II DNA or RNA helicase
MLAIRFATTAGRVELSSDAAFSRSLHALRSRLPSAASVTALSFEADLDDLLLNLGELARWPAADYPNVRWQPELRTLVEQNAADAAAVQMELDGAVGRPAADDVSALGGGWTGNLNELQRVNITKLLQLSHGANFSVPGAGKTRVTLAVFQARRDQGLLTRMLVVCPKSAFESWELETSGCYAAGRAPRLAVMDSQNIPLADIVLLNYERLPDARGALLQWLRAKPTLLVLDEAHRMKRGPAGVWGSVCLALGPYAAQRLILTGTPAPNGAGDLENLMSFVWPGQGRAAVSRAVGNNDLRRASELLKPLFVRTTKAQLNLPPVDIRAIPVALTPLHRELYDSLTGQMVTQARGGQNDIEALGKIMIYLLMAATTPALLATGASRHEPLAYRVPPLEPPAGSSLAELMRDLPDYEMSPKYQEALKLVADNARAGRKTLVWSTFVRSLRSLQHLMTAYAPAIVHGGIDNRADQLKRFREDPDCMVLLSNPATLGEGVSLHHECHEAVYVDRDFAAGRFLQSLDRIHRLGLSPDTVTRIRVLIATGTIDELVDQRLNTKLQFMGGVLNDPAVLELADLEEDPMASAGMDGADLQALIGYLHRAAR